MSAVRPKRLRKEACEITAGAGFVGADGGVGGVAAMVGGGLEPGIDVHGIGALQPPVGKGEVAPVASVAQGAVEEQHLGDGGAVEDNAELVVGDGVTAGPLRFGAGDAQAVPLEGGGHIGVDKARPVGEEEPLGAELPGGPAVVPHKGAVVPVGFDKGVAGRLAAAGLGDADDADVDDLGELGGKAVGEGQLGAVHLLLGRSGVGGSVEPFVELFSVEHDGDAVAYFSALQTECVACRT